MKEVFEKEEAFKNYKVSRRWTSELLTRSGVLLQVCVDSTQK